MTSHSLDPLPLSQTVTPSRTPYSLERDVLYGRPLVPLLKTISLMVDAFRSPEEFLAHKRPLMLHFIMF